MVLFTVFHPANCLLGILLTMEKTDILVLDTLDKKKKLLSNRRGISAGAAFLIKILSLCRRLSDISVVFLTVRKASSFAWNIFKL